MAMYIRCSFSLAILGLASISHSTAKLLRSQRALEADRDIDGVADVHDFDALDTDGAEVELDALQSSEAETELVSQRLGQGGENAAASESETLYKCPYGGQWGYATCETLGWRRATKRRKVFDGFCYNGEVDIFWARMRELKHDIDGVGLVITKQNFKGQWRTTPRAPKADLVKPMWLMGKEFDQCRSWRGFNSKCALSVAKNSVASAIEKFNPDHDDWVIFGDPDEIPNREFIKLLKDCEVPVGPGYAKEVMHLNAISHFLYDTQCKVTNSKWLWKNRKTPAIMKVSTMRKYGLRVHQVWMKPFCVAKGKYASCDSHVSRVSSYIPCSSWHLSSFGGVRQARQKIADNANNTHQISIYDVKSCDEHNWDRQMSVVRLDRPATKYPEVPHAVADDLKRFRVFVDAFH